MASKKIILLGSILILLVMGTTLLLAPRDAIQVQQLDNLPWQIQLHADGSSEVFGLRLGSTTVRQATAQLGLPEDIALFDQGADALALEVYFGTVSFGPLTAKVIAVLSASAEELQAILARSTKKEGASGGGFRHRLHLADQDAATERAIVALTYIPTHAGLDRDFLLQRFGPPDFFSEVGSDQELWLYPNQGLSLVYDSKGKEVFHYSLPAEFQLPPEARPWPGP